MIQTRQAQPSVLTDRQIVQALLDGEITVTPLLSPDQIGTNTLDLRLGTEFIVRKMDRLSHLDPCLFHEMQLKDPRRVLRYYQTIKRLHPLDPFILHPGQFVLASSLEYVKLAPYIGAFVEGRSTLGREALRVHSTASLIHPGHEGIIVFELTLDPTSPSIKLYPGTRVAQLWFYRMSTACERPYARMGSSKYARYVATNYGRPWGDWEFGAINRAKNDRHQEDPDTLVH